MKLKFTVALLTVFAVLGGSLGSAAAAPFDQNRIIDEAIYNNSHAMNVGQIDAFLNGFAHSCISPNSGFRSIDPTGYNPSQGYLFGGFVTAGQVIYDSAQAYGVNPQVLLATLEKEQSLVTGRNNYSGYCNNGDQHKYAAAVGYGCPDSGTRYDYTGLSLYQRHGTTITNTGTTCVNSASKAGFSQQVIRAAWLLKFGEQRSKGNVGWAVIRGNWDNSDDPQTCYGGPMTQGTWQRCPSGPATYYDGFITIDGAAVHMDNGAAAALYWYTPHFHGNQIFSDIFTNWFGSTVSSVLMRGSGHTVYVQGNDISTAYGVASGDVLRAYNLEGLPVSHVSDDYIASLNTTKSLTTLFLKPGDGTIYLADGGKMYGIPSGTICTKWALPCSDANFVATLPAKVTDRMTVGPAMTDLMKRGDVTYVMDAGAKQPFLFASDIALSPWASTPTVNINSPLNAGQPAGAPRLFAPHFIRIASTGGIYFYSNGSYFTFGSFDNFKNWIDNSVVANDTYSNLNTSPPTATVLADFTTDGTHNYYVNGPTKLRLPSSPSGTITNAAANAGLNALLSGKSTIVLDGTRAIRTPNGAIMMLTDGQLRPIPTLTDVNLLVGDRVTNVLSSFLSGYPTGKLAIPSGRIVKGNGGHAIYLYGANKYLWTFDTIQEVNTTLPWVPNGLNVDLNMVDSIGTASYARFIKIGSTYSAVQANGTIRPMPANILSSQKDNVTAVIESPISNLIRTDNRSTQFLGFDNGAIYAIQGNEIRAIGSFASYVALGGNDNNTIGMSIKSISAFNIGSPL